MKKRQMCLILVLLMISLVSIRVSAEWYSGHLHQHTGYSTDHGYDRDPSTQDDNCYPWGLEGHNDGWTVGVLSGQAILQGLNWFGLSDHSYCTNASEFDIVEQDCNTADIPLGFTCLMGEELSTSDVLNDGECILALSLTCSGGNGEVHIGAYGLGTHIVNSSANVTMRNLPFGSVTAIIKESTYRTNSVDVTGSDCIVAGTCINIGYAGGILVFNTTSFSSFAARGS